VQFSTVLEKDIHILSLSFYWHLEATSDLRNTNQRKKTLLSVKVLEEERNAVAEQCVITVWR
jgi:hypothetical protein